MTACQGAIGTLTDGPTDTVPPPTVVAPSPSPVAPDESPSAPAVPPESAFRRLTHAQFREAATELFQLGDLFSREDIQELLGAEPNIGGLYNDAAAQLVNQPLMGGYLMIASRAADRVLSRAQTAGNLRTALGCNADVGLQPCVVEFQQRTMAKAYRRPLVATDETALSELDQMVGQRVNTTNLELARERIRTFVIAVLISPEFLFLVERGIGDSTAGDKVLTEHEIATRLALLATNSLPDAELMADVASGAINQPDVRAAHLRRMLLDDTSKRGLVDLLVHWLEVDVELANLGEHPELGTPQLKARAVSEFRAFMQDWLFSGQSFRDFYTRPVSVYGKDGTTIPLNVGAFGLQAFIASHTGNSAPTPITRGAFVITRLLCEGLPPPPADIPEAPQLVDGLSQRDWLAQHRDSSCASCHNLIDNYGFPFLNYDLSSQFVLETQDGSIVDASATLPPIGDIEGPAQDLEAFSQAIGDAQASQWCMTDFWYRHAYGRTTVDGDKARIDELLEQWQASGGSALTLLEHIVASEDFTRLHTSDEENS